MGRSALLLVSSMGHLVKAWEVLRQRSTPKSRRSSGVDDQRIVDFDLNYAAHCRDLSYKLRLPGGYPFSRLRPHFIPKAGGKTRVICVPTVRDRVVQRALVDYLSDGDRCGLENNVSYGFIRGRSVEKAARAACRLRSAHRCVYKTDITAFFDEIQRDVLATAIRRVVRDRSLHALLISASHCEIEEASRTQSEKIRAAGIRSGRGIRQGMPLSPFFANLVLARFDRVIEKAGIHMVRYADDLICLADSKSACLGIHELVKNALQVEGLTVPDPGATSKTRIFEPEEAAEFLGLTLRPESGQYVLEVSAEQTRKMRQRIVDLADVAALARQGVDLGGFFKRVDGALAGYAGSYSFASNAAHVERALDGARQAAVTRLFEIELGIPVGALTPEKKKFIGLVE